MMLRRIQELLRNESGNFMISTIIGSMVMMVVIGAIAAGVLGIALFQKAITDKSEVTKQAAMADATLRSDILWASSITATDDKKVQLTVPAQNGACRDATWSVDTGADGKTVIDVTVINYPATDSTVNPVRCSGEPSAPSTQAIVTDADPASTFTYANAGGRALAFTAGTPAVSGPADAPAGVAAKAWASTKLSAVALNTAVASTTDRKTAYRFAQTADNLSVVQEAADAPSHFVPEGDLTALP
jgi:type II secretory pathway pseudopilin PulG